MASTARVERVGLAPAPLDLNDATPRSPAYRDIYFSADGGLAESRHVFIGGNRLRARWSAWRQPRPFVIGETGFGTGRNVLVAWQTFCAAASPGARLHMVSIERHPPRAEDLSLLWRQYPELAPHAQPLIERWPVLMRGTHRIRLGQRVTLDLVFGEVETALAEFDGYADAWFLDGFAPAHNPAMWRQAVFDQLAAASRTDATFATYTCARMVREHAAAAGFIWHKRPGAGRKRQMLCGRLDTAPTTGPVPAKRKHRPWYVPPAVSRNGPVAVIGAGIAGATVAEALARRGRRCDIYDPHGGPGGASGNAQGALHVRPSANGDLRTRFYLAALAYTQRWLADFDPGRRLWSDCGLLQLASDDREVDRQQRCIDNLQPPAALFHRVDAAAAQKHAGMPLAPNVRGGLWFPNAGWVRPDALCRRLIARSGARLHPTVVNTLQRHGRCWRLECANGQTADYGQVVFACAEQATALCGDLPPMDITRGQITGFQANGSIAQPDCVICGEGYVMPACNNRLHTGGIFTRHSNDSKARPADDRANHDTLAAFAPMLARQLDSPVAGRAAFRSNSYDRLPFAGPVPDTTAWRSHYADLAVDARKAPDEPGTHQPGLWASLAHGANGLVSAPLVAETLASRLANEPMLLPLSQLDALHPGRWLIRELIHGR